MSSAAASIRIFRDAPEATPATPIEQQLEQLQAQLDAVTRELDELRQRDQTRTFHIRRLDEELKLAARLQQDFLPKSLPQIGTVRFHTLYRPAGYVSGDLYDVMRLDESHVGFYVADAVGHGMPAALLTMFLKNALATKQIIAGGYRLIEPAETMARLNSALVAQNLSHATFATAVYGIVNTKTLQLTFARGGHPLPILLRADGSSETLQADGSLLGIFPEEQFAQTSVQLTAGDRVLIFSDGVEAAFDGDETAWRNSLLAQPKSSADALVATLASHVDKTGELPKDDVTMIVIEAQA